MHTVASHLLAALLGACTLSLVVWLLPRSAGPLGVPPEVAALISVAQRRKLQPTVVEEEDDSGDDTGAVTACNKKAAELAIDVFHGCIREYAEYFDFRNWEFSANWSPLCECWTSLYAAAQSCELALESSHEYFFIKGTAQSYCWGCLGDAAVTSALAASDLLECASAGTARSAVCKCYAKFDVRWHAGCENSEWGKTTKAEVDKIKAGAEGEAECEGVKAAGAHLSVLAALLVALWA